MTQSQLFVFQFPDICTDFIKIDLFIRDLFTGYINKINFRHLAMLITIY